MPAYKTPGVYIVEKSAFPNSVVEVATAVPAFIGYTEKASNKGTPLTGVPWRITSMAEFVSYYGGAPSPRFQLDALEEAASAQSGQDAGEGDEGGGAGAASEMPDDGFVLTVEDPESKRPVGARFRLSPAGGLFYLYYCMRLFFQNGGGPCYIVSVGDYSNGVDKAKLAGGIDPLLKEQEPTMVVVPDAMLIEKAAEAYDLQKAILQHCGYKMKSRIAVLDVYDGHRDRQDPPSDCIKDFRGALGINYLDYAAAYYPWVRTTVSSDRDVSFENITNGDALKAMLRRELGNLPETLEDLDEATASDEEKAKHEQDQQRIEAIDGIKDWPDTDEGQAEMAQAEKTLRTMSPNYQKIVEQMLEQMNLLPPAAAMAGVYTMVDNTRGVWKAPANVSLNGVIAPAVNITHDQQEDLNVSPQGKSVNAIRTFIGEGVLVWGARTLDGNSLDWRYVNVRRTMIMLEESIRLAAKAYVFDQNDAKTWTTIKSMIRNFLTGIWKRGGLAGASPEDAFSVHVGLGETMTPEDILEGILRVTVLVAVSRPAEFIEITFQQQMQKS